MSNAKVLIKTTGILLIFEIIFFLELENSSDLMDRQLEKASALYHLGH